MVRGTCLFTPAVAGSVPGLILLAVVRGLGAFGAHKHLVPLRILDGLDPRGGGSRNVGVLAGLLGRRLARSLVRPLDLLRVLRDVRLVGFLEPLELPQASAEGLKVVEGVVVAHVVDDRARRLDEVCDRLVAAAGGAEGRENSVDHVEAEVSWGALDVCDGQSHRLLSRSSLARCVEDEVDLVGNLDLRGPHHSTQE